jgi:general secretion pathway protein G
MIKRRVARAVVRGGFTLMEMLVVVAILVVLAGAAVPIYLNYLEQAKVDRAKSDVETLAKAVEAYKVQNEDWPQSLATLTQPSPKTGKATLTPENLLDPWERPYQYAPPGAGTHNGIYNRPDVWSEGPTPGDPSGRIGNWKNR